MSSYRTLLSDQGSIPPFRPQQKENLTSYRDNLVKAALVKIGEEFGVFTDYSIADVDVDICLSRSNLKESISKKIDPTTIAKLLPTLKTAVENAVGIECHANRYFYDNDTVMFENLLGGYVDGEKFVPIRFGLKHSVTGKATLYLIVDQEGIDVKKIKAEVTKATAVQFNDRPKTSRSAFNISVASVVPFVNKKDMLRYLPDDMLNNQQKKAKYEAIAETIDYTNDKNDRKYAEYIRDGKLSSAKQMVEAAARAAGYAGLYYHGAKKGGGFTKFRDWAYFTQNKGYVKGNLFFVSSDSVGLPDDQSIECVFCRVGKQKSHWNGTRQNPHSFAEMNDAEKDDFIKRNPDYGKIVCRCEMINEGEILEAIRTNPPALDMDGVKRRTRSGMGRCQGGFCGPYVMELISRQLRIPMEEVTKKGGKSKMVTERIGEM